MGFVSIFTYPESAVFRILISTLILPGQGYLAFCFTEVAYRFVFKTVFGFGAVFIREIMEFAWLRAVKDFAVFRLHNNIVSGGEFNGQAEFRYFLRSDGVMSIKHDRRLTAQVTPQLNRHGYRGIEPRVMDICGAGDKEGRRALRDIPRKRQFNGQY